MPKVRAVTVWMASQDNGILCPSLWHHTRKELIHEVEVDKETPWEILKLRGWKLTRVRIEPLKR